MSLYQICFAALFPGNNINKTSTILVSKDMFIIDGHHRWFSFKSLQNSNLDYNGLIDIDQFYIKLEINLDKLNLIKFLISSFDFIKFLNLDFLFNKNLNGTIDIKSNNIHTFCNTAW